MVNFLELCKNLQQKIERLEAKMILMKVVNMVAALFLMIYIMQVIVHPFV